MATDDKALTEQIARALTEHWKRKHSTLLTTGPCSGCTRTVLPTIREAQAEAWDHGEAMGYYNTGPRRRISNPYRTEQNHD